MAAFLKLIIVSMMVEQTTGSASSFLDASPARGLQASSVSAANPAPGPSASGVSEPATGQNADGHNSGSYSEATSSDKAHTSSDKATGSEDNSAWSSDDMITMVICVAVIYPIFGLVLSLAVYLCYKKETAKAEADVKPVVSDDAGSNKYVEPLKIGADLKAALADDGVSTNAGSQSPSRRTSLGSDDGILPVANTDTQRL